MDRIHVAITPVVNGYEVTSSVVENTSIPVEIYLYENLGTATLGDYVGIVSASDLHLRSIWTGVAMPAFGNRFVRTANLTLLVENKETADAIAANILKGAKKLKSDLAQELATSTTYTL